MDESQRDGATKAWKPPDSSRSLMRVSVLTISDSVAAGKAEDRSGPVVDGPMRGVGLGDCGFAVCADDRPAIEAFLKGVLIPRARISS